MSHKIVEQYEYFIGVEEEAFILNEEGFLTPHAYRVADTLLDKVNRDRDLLMKVRRKLLGLQWEPSPSQIEYVTRPLPPTEIYETIQFSRYILGDSAEERNLTLAYISMHPIQSNPHPMNGTHINISFREEGMTRPSIELLNYTSNFLRNYIPEMIAITANTPIMNGIYNGYASNRLMNSKVLKENPYSEIVVQPVRVVPPTMRSRFRYGVIFEKIRRYIRRIEVNPQGDRLADLTVRGPVTNILEDMFKDPETTRIEIRFIDNQISIDYLNDAIILILGLVMEGIYRHQRGYKLRKRNGLSRLRWEAITNGIEGLAEDGRTFGERIQEIINKVDKYISRIGFEFKSPIKNGIPEAKINKIKIIDNNPELTRLSIEGRYWIKIKLSGERQITTTTGKTRKSTKDIYNGVHIIQYEINFTHNRGILNKIKSIKKHHLLYTKEGYIKIHGDDKILEAEKPIIRISNVLSKGLLKMIYR